MKKKKKKKRKRTPAIRGGGMRKAELSKIFDGKGDYLKPNPEDWKFPAGSCSTQRESNDCYKTIDDDIKKINES